MFAEEIAALCNINHRKTVKSYKLCQETINKILNKIKLELFFVFLHTVTDKWLNLVQTKVNQSSTFIYNLNQKDQSGMVAINSTD